jgi:hypothetical protein
MKPILFILCLIVAGEARSQKLHAYSQRIVPGTRQATFDKDGNLNMEKRKEIWQHPLYLEIPAGKDIRVTEVWLNGERYAFDTATVKGPVVEETGLSVPGQSGKILIPSTDKKILHIMLKGKIDVTDKNKRKITGRKKVVVYYTRNGKTCYRSSNKIQELQEMLMQ